MQEKTMNYFNILIGILYIMAMGQAIWQAKPAFGVLYFAWSLGCFAVAYIEAHTL
jgi:hypothetical protein